MIYYKFRNYEEFKELFGIQYHANGAKSRKNKILLSYIKDKKLLHDAVTSGDFSLLHISSMAELKQKINERIMMSAETDETLPYEVQFKDYALKSALYRTDDANGICEDGDFRSIRYINMESERVFKMKIGKFYRKIIEENAFGKTLPEQVKTYLCEEITQDWQVYVMGHLPSNRLVVDDDFERIYDSDQCVGDFGSCMVNRNLHDFYKNAVNASAAYLEDMEDLIIARCIIFNEVKDQHGRVWRLAERQYSSDGSDVLKRALVDALIKGGHIDGYKQIGAGCSDARAFVDNEGNSLSDLELTIKCNLDYDETLSYQDSFKYYDDYYRKATNYGEGYLRLDTTNGSLEEDEDDSAYDNYHDYSCAETTTVYYRGREYECDSNNMDDFVWVEETDEYHHIDDVYTCPECEEYFLDGVYSDLLEEKFCCDSCLDKAEEEYKKRNWTYAEYDKEYFENEDDVTTFMFWNALEGKYIKTTISVQALDEKLLLDECFQFDDVVYSEINEDTGLPYGMRLVPIEVIAA